ncbi:MAG: hypothetical protein JHC95_10275 [Solirubrobacteraceae bacterium]|nr:hypothetical protein [Solirubrobacteraceae bacterium]
MKLTRGSAGGRGDDAKLAAIVLMVPLVVGGIFLLSLIGHPLGLTPSASEIFGSDKPEGWLDRHYDHVLLGYALTALLLVGVIGIAALVVTAVRRLAPVEKTVDRRNIAACRSDVLRIDEESDATEAQVASGH